MFRFVHNNINVLDLERSLSFYEEALGLKEIRRLTLPTPKGGGSVKRAPRSQNFVRLFFLLL